MQSKMFCFNFKIACLTTVCNSNLSETGYFFNPQCNSLNLGQVVRQKCCIFRSNAALKYNKIPVMDNPVKNRTWW